jgi:hypothetical protein
MAVFMLFLDLPFSSPTRAVGKSTNSRDKPLLLQYRGMTHGKTSIPRVQANVSILRSALHIAMLNCQSVYVYSLPTYYKLTCGTGIHKGKGEAMRATGPVKGRSRERPVRPDHSLRV